CRALVEVERLARADAGDAEPRADDLQRAQRSPVAMVDLVVRIVAPRGVAARLAELDPERPSRGAQPEAPRQRGRAAVQHRRGVEVLPVAIDGFRAADEVIDARRD